MLKILRMSGKRIESILLS